MERRILYDPREEKGTFDGGQTVGFLQGVLGAGELGHEAGKVDWRHMGKGTEF